MKPQKRRFGVVIALGCLVATTVAPSAGAAPADALRRLRRSVAITQHEGSARIVGDMEIESSALSGTVEIDGVIDFETGATRMVTDMGPLGLPLQFTQISVDGVNYLNLDDLFGALPESAVPDLGGRRWVAADPAELKESSAAGAPTDPASQLETLLGVDPGTVETVGEGEVRGVTTTHYRGSVDFAAAIDAVPKRYRDRLEPTFDLFEAFGNVPVDAWIDAQGRVRRIRMQFDLDVREQHISEVMTLDYVDFGTAVDVDAPPADDVMGFDEYLDLVEELQRNTGSGPVV